MNKILLTLGLIFSVGALADQASETQDKINLLNAQKVVNADFRAQQDAQCAALPASRSKQDLGVAAQLKVLQDQLAKAQAK